MGFYKTAKIQAQVEIQNMPVKLSTTISNLYNQDVACRASRTKAKVRYW
jgi:hypothetical protein